MVKPIFQCRPQNWRFNAFLYCLGGTLLVLPPCLYAREYYFNPSSLEGDKLARQDIDLSLFSKRDAQLPGTYLSKIVLNKQKMPDESIEYISGPQGVLQPVLTPLLLKKWGVKIEDYPELAQLPPDKKLDAPLSHYIPFSSAIFDFNKMSLSISMPQAAIIRYSPDYVDPSRWDNGTLAAFTDYSFSGNERDDSHQHSSSQYLNLRNGINVGGWRLRSYSTWSNADSEQSWNTINSWIQHDIKALKAQFVGGENSTRGEVFDSLQYRGVNIASDEEMLPNSQRGYAPIIRGTANSNAEVSVRQNGYLIYQTTVAPGPFEISDLYSTTTNGDLDITVKEADGSEHHFTQPYSGVAIMQRPGHLKFEATAGRYRADNNYHASEPLFLQGSAIYGLNNNLTLFGGVTGSGKYTAANLGVGVTLGELGSLSADVTHARTTLNNDEQKAGQSYRLLYSGQIDSTNTNFTLASYRYSTSGYYSFADANEKYDGDENDWSFHYNKRNRIQVSISQSVVDSSIYLNGYQQNFWGTSKTEKSLSAGINSNVYGINVNLAYTYSKTSDDASDQSLSLGFSIPLSQWMPDSWASYAINSVKGGDVSQRVSLSGTLLEDQRLSYTLQQSQTNHGGEATSSLYSGYRSRYGNMNLGYSSSSNDTQQLNYGLNGGIVAHSGGLTLAQPLGNQFAIVSANGASGIKFINQHGIQTDWLGNAIIPSLTPYQENVIRLDTTTLPDDIDSGDTAVTVVPNRNAAVLAHFDARIGYRALISLKRPDGRAVPFGALATVDSTSLGGIVDDAGVLYLSGMEQQTALTIKWGNAPGQQCHAVVTLPVNETKRILIASALCK
ncbi:fimbria/pilus outer membrane usher protein [Atlantibacter subterraneus]|uniref:fimbria/pilus outer membrane usher protein n=1 Tax=Atlantibacter subterraneus TaxID=255519 RepID=UPI0029643750|nr:fimbria/pilus outer membrane usher protein [Atlantibacter subterranea]MDW2741277.1 fimbria/pilus outer membrane usher protein [Atlantibacter subterranea]